MKIEKINNGYLIEYSVDIREEGKNNWDSAYTFHRHAFHSWAEVLVWLDKNEDKVD